MDCNRIQDRLVDYLTEDTRITERLCVEVHLATCYHCREAMDDVRTVLDAAKDSTRYNGREATFEVVMSEIRTREALLADARQPSVRWSWGIAAAALPIVVACITPFVVAWPGTPRGATGAEAAQSVQDMVLPTDVKLLDLADPTSPLQIETLLAPN